MPTPELAPFLQPSPCVESDAPAVRAFAARVTEGAADDRERAVRLFYAVRDEIRYDPYGVVLTPDFLGASSVLTRGAGFCVAKAVVLAAAARAVGIPARLGFADVRNHLTTERLRAQMGTDVFVFHGFTELFLDDRWVKATPTFNRSLCDRFGVKPLEFDGVSDSVLHPFDTAGERHMEYLRDRGTHVDVPFDEMHAVFAEYYPGPAADGASGDFEREADADRAR
ncbi:MAG: transglutaminase family protein [Deltaproteobacteria bacterium]|nr:transglutaminase family protein [Deltaproteobacteria bacterium]